MTAIPQIPSNLLPNTVGTDVSSLVKQAVPQFPAMPSIPNIDVAGQAQALVGGAVAGALAGPLGQLQQFSAASQTTLALIENAIPEEQILAVIEKFKLPDGTIEWDKVEIELDKLGVRITETYKKIIDGLQLPPISVSGLLAELIPDIPIPEIPSPGDIKQYINNFIERKKLAQQQALMKLQAQKAKLERTPFTARLDTKNTRNLGA